MSKDCLVASISMPGMSKGFRANMLAFAQRKSMSIASYLGSRLTLIFSALPSDSLGLSKTSLVSSTGLKLLV